MYLVSGLADCLVCLLQLLSMFVKGMNHCLSDLEVVSLAEMAHGHVGGDLKAVCLEGRGGWAGGVTGCIEAH